MKYYFALPLLSCCIAIGSTVTAAERVLIRFDKELDQLKVPRSSFGIFRDDRDAPTEQAIIEEHVVRTLPDRTPKGFLQLSYLLRKPGAFNGWWHKPRKPSGPEEFDDWSDYRNGALIFRLRVEGATPKQIKIEIKTPDAEYPAYIRFTTRRLKQIRDQGFADCVIPFAAVVGRRERLNRISELLLVLEQKRIGVPSGQLLIESIRLTSEQQQLHPTDALIEEMRRQAFTYFRDHRHPKTGFVRDRAANLAGAPPDTNMASIAATGYALSALPIAVKSGWLSKQEASQEALGILQAAKRAEQQWGLFYHFQDWETGKRWNQSEISTLDSAIFFNGAITIAQFLPETRPLVEELLNRAQWDKFVTEKNGKRYLALGWQPNEGLIGALDVRTTESAMALLLACGSGKVDKEVWYNTTYVNREVAGYDVLHGELPLFVSYYGLGWLNLEGMVDQDGVDLHQNAINAALANRKFCRNVLAQEFDTFSKKNAGWWGVSAGDSIDQYVAPGPIFGESDGTAFALAAIAAYPWIPDHIEFDVERWRASMVWPRVMGKYGLAPFNISEKFIGRQIIAIDLGSFLINANRDKRLVNELFMSHSLVQRAIKEIGFTAKGR